MLSPVGENGIGEADSHDAGCCGNSAVKRIREKRRSRTRASGADQGSAPLHGSASSYSDQPGRIDIVRLAAEIAEEINRRETGLQQHVLELATGINEVLQPERPCMPVFDQHPFVADFVQSS